MTWLAPSPRILTRSAHLARPQTARSLQVSCVDRGYPLEGTSSVGGYQPKRANPARFDPPPRKGTAPCLDSVGLSSSLSSSPPWHYPPPRLRQHAPTETVIPASSPLSGTPSPRSSLGMVIAALIRTAGASRANSRAKLLSEAHLGATCPSFLYSCHEVPLYGHLFSLDNGPNGALMTMGGPDGTPDG
jgi:hypothetical protein